ncbi:MAG: hypothetical protein JWM77_1687 [Rhodospirillales bacterium]|nr:hypothetical protein [Rhodospirillales bacterium]
MIYLRAASPDDAAQIATIELDNYEHAYRGHGFDAWLDQQTIEKYVPWWRERLHALTPGVEMLVAMDGALTVLGFGRLGPARHGPADGAGEFQKVYVARKAHRLGVGRTLMGAMAARLHHLGYQQARVWVLTSNQPARRFYEQIGGELVDFTYDELLDDGTVLPHVGYGWRDLAELYKLVPS